MKCVKFKNTSLKNVICPVETKTDIEGLLENIKEIIETDFEIGQTIELEMFQIKICDYQNLKEFEEFWSQLTDDSGYALTSELPVALSELIKDSF